jgi:glycosyltransferase involved in cell wall biosynthesis
LRLSIITINLNNYSGLKKTIESVICQSFTDFEFLIIDGGSSDQSINIIKMFENRIDYWVSESDSGIYNAFNKGIQKSKAEYCFFLNSGDYLVSPNVLEMIFKNEFHDDVIFGNMFVLLNNKIVGKSKGNGRISFLDIYDGMIKHQASFIRKKLFEEFGYYNEQLKIIADWEFFLKSIGFGGATYKYIDIDITCFDNNGISNNNAGIVEQERKIVLDSCLPLMMHKDYSFLQNFSRYEILTRYKVTNFILKLMSKGLKVFESLTSCK